MLSSSAAFSGFAVNDIDAARAFYADVLGLPVELNEMGILDITLGSGAHVIAYPKEDHEPAGFTILNFPVGDLDAAVDELNSRGVTTKIYDDPQYGGDEKGIVRGENGPAIAWFRDPAGNVLAVMEEF
jgi:catechol 2,3-dioxygenase-like lactoylglutathione lyase family enzyme